MAAFALELKREGGAEPPLLDAIHQHMEALVRAYIEEKLEDCSDLTYVPGLAKGLVGREDFGDLVGAAGEWNILTHVQNVIRAYVGEVSRSRPVKVSNRAKFGVSMDLFGMWIGFSTDSAHERGAGLRPDGNVVVLSVLTAAILLAVFLWRK